MTTETVDLVAATVARWLGSRFTELFAAGPVYVGGSRDAEIIRG